jgi:hypothetical protein
VYKTCYSYYVLLGSQNGSYVNDAHTHIKYGQRYELRSGDEVFLLYPGTCSEQSRFIFVNKRERDISRLERAVLASQTRHHSVPSQDMFEAGDTSNENSTGGMLGKSIPDCPVVSQARHIPGKYEIGGPVGSGSCGSIHVCVDRTDGKQYAVKVRTTLSSHAQFASNASNSSC